jgi:hypothetical protein
VILVDDGSGEEMVDLFRKEYNKYNVDDQDDKVEVNRDEKEDFEDDDVSFDIHFDGLQEDESARTSLGLTPRKKKKKLSMKDRDEEEDEEYYLDATVDEAERQRRRKKKRVSKEGFFNALMVVM